MIKFLKYFNYLVFVLYFLFEVWKICDRSLNLDFGFSYFTGIVLMIILGSWINKNGSDKEVLGNANTIGVVSSAIILASAFPLIGLWFIIPCLLVGGYFHHKIEKRYGV